MIIITDNYTVQTCSLLTSPSWGQHKACLGISQTPECGALIWCDDLWLLWALHDSVTVFIDKTSYLYIFFCLNIWMVTHSGVLSWLAIFKLWYWIYFYAYWSEM